jgi:tRNA(His) 5'-end guanylyltransferase
MDFDERMMGYTKVTDHTLMRKQPVIMWIDGKAFHTFCRGLNKPFDEILIKTMQEVAVKLCENIQGAKLAYVQSDEISIVLTDWDKLETDAWFKYRVQKMASIGASMTTMWFNKLWLHNVLTDASGLDEIVNHGAKQAMFDCRVFNLPNHEVENWLVYRQRDWLRNSIQMLARTHFSQAELHKKNNFVMKKMLEEIGIGYKDHVSRDLDWTVRHGSVIAKDYYQSYESLEPATGKFEVIEDAPLFKDARELYREICNLCEESSTDSETI